MAVITVASFAAFANLVVAACRLASDPDPAGRFRVLSTMPPEHYEAAVAGAVDRIRGGQFEKVVLAREVEVHAPTAHDAGAVFGVLRDAFPTCSVFVVMFSAWNAKISTNVASSAAMLTGANRGRSTVSNQSRPLLRISHCRSRTPAVKGTTMNTMTEYSST